MIIEHSTVNMMLITGAPALDPIRVVTEDYMPCKGRIIITCYDQAWVGYWGAMGGRTIKQFFVAVPADLLSGNLSSGQKRQTKNDLAYLIRIIKAVQEAFTSKGEV